MPGAPKGGLRYDVAPGFYRKARSPESVRMLGDFSRPKVDRRHARFALGHFRVGGVWSKRDPDGEVPGEVPFSNLKCQSC